MHAYLLLSEAPPRLVVTSGATIGSGGIAHALGACGVRRFIAHEVPVACLRRHYGGSWEAIEADLKGRRGLRVLDHDGESVMRAVHLDHLGPAVRREVGDRPSH